MRRLPPQGNKVTRILCFFFGSFASSPQKGRLFPPWPGGTKNSGLCRLLFVFFRKAACVPAVLFLVLDSGHSQTVNPAAQLATPLGALGASARADALGDAWVGLADDPSALFFNSAGLSGLQNTSLSINHNSYLAGVFEETLLFRNERGLDGRMGSGRPIRRMGKPGREGRERR